MRYYEQEHVDEMLNKALSMNIEQEVARRIKIASQIVEESQSLKSKKEVRFIESSDRYSSYQS